ncbi:hypothetical protein VTK73DRAFT_6140 [Phialemonium thermophilum]|uniref:Uncharacterized protein n=1 Tax=Phialemonium thermophilum TaxID=223376 RepID=A0ABR3V1L9_9PEZI
MPALRYRATLGGGRRCEVSPSAPRSLRTGRGCQTKVPNQGCQLVLARLACLSWGVTRLCWMPSDAVLLW